MQVHHLGFRLRNVQNPKCLPMRFQALLLGRLRRSCLRQFRKLHQWLCLVHAWTYQDGRLVAPTLRAAIGRRGAAALICYDVSTSRGKECPVLEDFPATLQLLVENPQREEKYLLTLQNLGAGSKSL